MQATDVESRDDAVIDPENDWDSLLNKRVSVVLPMTKSTTRIFHGKLSHISPKSVVVTTDGLVVVPMLRADITSIVEYPK